MLFIFIIGIFICIVFTVLDSPEHLGGAWGTLGYPVTAWGQLGAASSHHGATLEATLGHLGATMGPPRRHPRPPGCPDNNNHDLITVMIVVILIVLIGKAYHVQQYSEHDRMEKRS